MKIINDNITIVQGETPTHNRAVIDKDTGAPYIISKGINNPYIEFIVRPSVYTKKNDYVFKAYLDCSNIKRFDEIVDYNDVLWTDEEPSDTSKLYRRNFNGDYDYRYWDSEKTYDDGTHWHPYEFRITFTFPYADGQVKRGEETILKSGGTSVMEAKTYKYDITLFGGIKKAEFNPGEIPIIIDYKKPLLTAANFIVEGSASE